MRGKERRMFLADWLEKNVTPDRLDMGMYSSPPYGEDCGTVRCAAGWATQIPEFQALGFKAVNSGLPSFEGRLGLVACAHFFEVSIQHSVRLFTAEGYTTRHPPISEVAARLRNIELELA